MYDDNLQFPVKCSENFFLEEKLDESQQCPHHVPIPGNHRFRSDKDKEPVLEEESFRAGCAGNWTVPGATNI